MKAFTLNSVFKLLLRMTAEINLISSYIPLNSFFFFILTTWFPKL